MGCSWRRRAKRPGRSRFGDRMDPAAQERLPLAVDEDVGPPQGMLEEFERFSATWGGKRPTTRYRKASSRGAPSAWSISAALTREARRVCRRSRARLPRRSSPPSLRIGGQRDGPSWNSSSSRSTRSPSGRAKSAPRSARPSLMKKFGVLIRTRLHSMRPRSTRSASFQACSRWCGKGLVRDGVREVGALAGRSVLISTRDGAAVIPVIGGPGLVPDDRHAEAITSGRPNSASDRARNRSISQSTTADRRPVGDLELASHASTRATRSPSPGAAPRGGWPPRQGPGPGCGGARSRRPCDEVLIAHQVAGERGRLRFERHELCRQPRSPIGSVDLLGHACPGDAASSRAAPPASASVRSRPALSARQAVVRSRSARARVLVEAQAEQQVVPGDRVRLGTVRRPPGRAAPPSPLHALGARRARRVVVEMLLGPGGARRPGARSDGSWATRAWRAARRRIGAHWRRIGSPGLAAVSHAGLAEERHPLPLHRVEAHAQRGRLLLRHLTDVGRLLLRGHRAPTDRAFRLPDEQPREVVAVHAPPRRRQQVVGQLEPDLEGAEGSAASRSPSSINCRVRAMSSSRVMPAPRRG